MSGIFANSKDRLFSQCPNEPRHENIWDEGGRVMMGVNE